VEIKTNIEEVRKIPRVAGLLPGKYPEKVVRVKTGGSSSHGRRRPRPVLISASS